jgi:DNA repair exonuclease SbcCD ATPase subunit
MDSVGHVPDLTNLNPDEEMAILDQLLDLQQRDQEFDDRQQRELEKVEGEIAEQQDLLHKLRNSLKTYHELKAQYELVMVELQQLEKEKTELKARLDRAGADPTLCSKSIQRDLERVEQALARARNESRKHRELYRKAEQEAKKCGVLERQIASLKQGRAKLQKQQQQAAAAHRANLESKTRELLQLRRRERKNEHTLSQLQKEIAVQKRHLDQRHEYITKLNGKLKETERHLVKLLSLRRNHHSLQHHRNSRTIGVVRNVTAAPETASAPSTQSSAAPPPSIASSHHEVESLQYLVEEWVSGRVEQAQLQLRYQELVASYGSAMRDLVARVKALEERREENIPKDPSEVNPMDVDAPEPTRSDSRDESSTAELEQNLQELELKVELLGQELDSVREQLGEDDAGAPSGGSDTTQDLEALLGDKDASILKVVLVEALEDLVSTRVRSHALDRSQKRVESIRQGLEDEVESLNSQLQRASRELSHHHLQQSSAGTVDRLEKEKSQLEDALARAQGDLAAALRSAETLRKSKSVLESDLCEAREKLALHVAVDTLESQAFAASEAVLAEIQVIWNDVGLSPSPRDEVRRDIQNSLPDTCARKLREAQDFKDRTLQELASVRDSLSSMQSLLGIASEPMDTSASLLRQLELLREAYHKLEPTFEAAKTKAESILQQAKDIAASIALAGHELHNDLLRLGTIDLPVGSLSEDSLRRCERHLAALRLKRSTVLAQNSVCLSETHILVVEMNLRSEQILPLTLQSMKKRHLSSPDWWDDGMASAVASALSIPGGVARVTPGFSQHLLLIAECLQSLSKGRRSLSDLLRQLIERAQKTLLATVKGDEVDASEACATVCEALFRLPALSKERIHACISEIESLLTGVDAMTQSEIEALSVIWEAMEVSTSERGRFWGEIEDSMKATEGNLVGPLDAVLQICLVDGEEWVLSAVRDATKSYRQLESRVYKLGQIHQEVERLRSKQDAKSKIISLDSEVRVLSSKLAEFEDKKCNKQRLLTKKSNSSHLLKEERFRKQMQQKYSSKLEQLAKLLTSWRENEHFEFDLGLLSDEVRSLLKNPDDMNTLVEKRTEFMHLRTVKSSKRAPVAVPRSFAQHTASAKKSRGTPEVATTASGPSEVEKLRFLTDGQTPTKASKRAAPEYSRRTKKPKSEKVLSSPFRSQLLDSRAVADQRQRTTRTTSAKPPPLAPSLPNPSPSRTKSPAAESVKRLTLPPFGHVFEQVETPRHGSGNRENNIADREIDDGSE